MRRNMHISKIGLKLIKAYEGYRPVDRHLVNGHHVVGYGHIIEGDDSLVLTRAEAETLLLNDLKPYEDMVNETVHAPLTQSQFDALVSLAFNIGPRAFTASDTLRALNNGRPLDAASGFDIWRKSTIDGKTYVVDALMRRRAAEKTLFLRTEGKKTLPASRADLPPVRDEMVALLTTEDALPILSNDPRNGLVARVPYEAGEITQTDFESGEVNFDEADHDEADHDESNYDVADGDAADYDEAEKYVSLAAPELKITQDELNITQSDMNSQYGRRREDGPSGILELSEVYEDGEPRARREDDDLVDATYEIDDFDYEDVPFDEIAEAELKTGLDESTSVEGASLIADTASKLSGRLDALIDNVASDDASVKADNWPEALIQAADMTEDTTQATAEMAPSKAADIVIDNLVEDDAFRERTDSAAKYISIEPPMTPEREKEGLGYFIPLLIGMSLIGASAGAIFGNPTSILGEWGPLISFIGLIMGVIMTIFTLYYAAKANK